MPWIVHHDRIYHTYHFRGVSLQQGRGASAICQKYSSERMLHMHQRKTLAAAQGLYGVQGAVLRELEKQTSIKSCSADEGGCGRRQPMQQFLEGTPPAAFALQLVWESGQESGQDIRDTLDIIREVRAVICPCMRHISVFPPRRAQNRCKSLCSSSAIFLKTQRGHVPQQCISEKHLLPCTSFV